MDAAAPVQREVSAGGVVYRRDGDGIEVVLASRRTRRGDLAWGLAKGGIEAGRVARRRRGARGPRGDRIHGRDRVLARRDALLLRLGGDPDPQDRALLPDAMHRWRPRRSRRRDGGGPLVPPGTRAQAGRVPRASERCSGGRPSSSHESSRRSGDPTMTPFEALLGFAIGLVAGVLSGLFGVGGGIVMTPGLQVMRGRRADRGARDPAAGDPADGAHRRPHLPQGGRDRRAGGRLDDRPRGARVDLGRLADDASSTPTCCS